MKIPEDWQETAFFILAVIACVLMFVLIAGIACVPFAFVYWLVT